MPKICENSRKRTKKIVLSLIVSLFRFSVWRNTLYTIAALFRNKDETCYENVVGWMKVIRKKWGNFRDILFKGGNKVDFFFYLNTLPLKAHLKQDFIAINNFWSILRLTFCILKFFFLVGEREESIAKNIEEIGSVVCKILKEKLFIDSCFCFSF